MKYLIVFLFTVSFSVQAQELSGIVLWGDSHSVYVTDGTPYNAWPKLAEDQMQVSINSTSFTSKTFFKGTLVRMIKRDNIRPDSTADTIVTWRGTNDAWPSRNISPSMMEVEVISLISEAALKGWNLICLGPPDNIWVDVEPYRQVLETYCPTYWRVPNEFNVGGIIVPLNMPDGAHFDKAGHQLVADWFVEKMSTYSP